MTIPSNSYDALKLRGNEYVANQTFNARILSLLKNDQYLDAELSAHVGNVNPDQHTQYVLRDSAFVTDMNTVKTGGMYNALSNVTNGPGSGYSGFILVFRKAGTSVTQIWYDFGGAALNHIFEREYTDGNSTWTAWVNLTVPTGVRGDVLINDGNGWLGLAHGILGQFLQTNGHGNLPTWETLDFTSGSGYQYLPSGLIIQWGIVSATDTLTAHNYPIAFPSSALAIASSTYNDGDGSRACGCALYTKTQYYAHKDSGTASDISWIAVGT